MRHDPWRWLMVICGLTLLLNLGQALLGAWTTGVSIDEPAHVARLQSFLRLGWYLQPAQLLQGRPAPGLGDAYVYGPAAALLAHGLGLLAGTDSPDVVGTTLAAYGVRHLAVVLIGVLGVLATAALAMALVDSRLAGLLAAALLLAIPMWTGHLMFNIKDIPVASGYTLFSLGLLWIWQLPERPGSALGLHRVGAPLAAVFGAVLAIGTRPGMWVPLALTLALLLVLDVAGLVRRAATGQPSGWRAWRRPGLLLAVPLLVAVLLEHLYPLPFRRPLAAALGAARGSADYASWNRWSLSAGQFHLQPPPGWYVPVWLGHQLPLLIGLLAGLGMAALLVRRRPGGWLLVMAQLLLVPLAAVLMGSALYDGLRQLLFVVPPLAVLAAAGVLAWRQQSEAMGRCGVAPALVAGLALLLPSLEQLRLFPYNYAYFNELASTARIDGRWPTDYWRTAYRELLPLVPVEAPAVCHPASADPSRPLPVGPAENPCDRRALVKPYAPLRGRARASLPRLATGEFWYLSENRYGRRSLPPNCLLERQVSRPLRGQHLAMAWLARCRPAERP